MTYGSIYVINYSELGMFCTEHDIKEIVMAGDIMSYHQERIYRAF
jgi:deoxyribodipyrimidine photo-lyase